MNRLATPTWTLLRTECYLRDDYTCRKCHKKTKTPAAHHVVPFIQGGKDEITNLITVCKKCHRWMDNEVLRVGITRYMRDYILTNKAIEASLMTKETRLEILHGMKP